MINRFAVFTTMLCAAVLSGTPNLQAQKSEVKNIVLVHGAWADGSGWRGVYENLVRDGFTAAIGAAVQNHPMLPPKYVWLYPVWGQSYTQIEGETEYLAPDDRAMESAVRKRRNGGAGNAASRQQAANCDIRCAGQSAS